MNFEQRSREFFSELSNQKELPRSFYKSLEYSFFSGGKRVRPRCLDLIGREWKLPSNKLYPAALSIELIHTYSLVHDDLPVMDDDTYRRGKVTHHVKYGEASAVLAGDTFLTLAFQVLAENYQGEVLKNLVRELSQCSGVHGMAGGQVLDCLTQERSKKIFEKIHYLKTAKLFECSFVAPGLIAELGRKDISTLRSLGCNLGLLFQLQDDLFDENKKSKRLEENILSIVSKEELLNMIKEKEEGIRENLFNLQGFSDNKDLIQFIDQLADRVY